MIWNTIIGLLTLQRDPTELFFLGENTAISGLAVKGMPQNENMALSS
jgi:hypothetical protein